MPCQVDISQGEVISHYKKLWCQACRYLTPKQIESLQNPGSGIYGGIALYCNHLMEDYTGNPSHSSEKAFAKRELNRIGYDLVKIPGGLELVKL